MRPEREAARAPASPGRRLRTAWTRAARRIGDAQARLVLVLLYAVVVPPFALAVRLFADPLGVRGRGPARWQARPDLEGTALERALRHF